MAKVKIEFDVNKAIRDLENDFGDRNLGSKVTKEIGEFVTDRIRFEARRETPLNDKRKFPALKGSSVEIREKLSFFNRTHPSFRAPRSNATLTGQLLNAVTFLAGRNEVKIFVDNSKRRPTRTGPDRISDDDKTNKEVDEFLRIIGFEIFTASGVASEPKVVKRIRTIIERQLRRILVDR